MKAKAPAAEFLAANEASMDAIHALAAEGLEYAGRVAALNLATVRTATADSARQAQAMLGADDVAALQKLQSDGLEPQIALAVAYVRDISEIATDAHQQFIEITQAWISRIKTMPGQRGQRGVEFGVGRLGSPVRCARVGVRGGLRSLRKGERVQRAGARCACRGRG